MWMMDSSHQLGGWVVDTEERNIKEKKNTCHYQFSSLPANSQSYFEQAVASLIREGGLLYRKKWKKNSRI
jgi:hypothetical protein